MNAPFGPVKLAIIDSEGQRAVAYGLRGVGKCCECPFFNSEHPEPPYAAVCNLADGRQVDELDLSFAGNAQPPGWCPLRDKGELVYLKAGA
jgi:hypothetical protein